MLDAAEETGDATKAAVGISAAEEMEGADEAVGTGEPTVLADVVVALGAEPVAGLAEVAGLAAADVVDDAALVTDDATLVAVEVTEVTGLVSGVAEATPSNRRIRMNAPAPARTRRINQRISGFAPTAGLITPVRRR